ncbi:hypothetical protein SEMRO_334_G119941.1 [Seminavis robusta]|uniref:Uncharacterized protein n=1 Tax=Seminavis robusta TaxID=568900 RepID=A0A9N8DWX9_9STRA|nr:hypothetical protein SEMRO_334_G119941.1 [Seminavis robusta]|eukprot:Sro334_g119941.1  (103) ;mRNA; r:74004-74312
MLFGKLLFRIEKWPHRGLIDTFVSLGSSCRLLTPSTEPTTRSSSRWGGGVPELPFYDAETYCFGSLSSTVHFGDEARLVPVPVPCWFDRSRSIGSFSLVTQF